MKINSLTHPTSVRQGHFPSPQCRQLMIWIRCRFSICIVLTAEPILLSFCVQSFTFPRVNNCGFFSYLLSNLCTTNSAPQSHPVRNYLLSVLGSILISSWLRHLSQSLSTVSFYTACSLLKAVMGFPLPSFWEFPLCFSSDESPVSRILGLSHF